MRQLLFVGVLAVLYGVGLWQFSAWLTVTSDDHE